MSETRVVAEIDEINGCCEVSLDRFHLDWLEIQTAGLGHHAMYTGKP